MNLEPYSRHVNLFRAERLVSLVTGGTLISMSLLRRSRATLPLAVLGGGLVVHAVNRNQGDGGVEETYTKGTPTTAVIEHGHGICVEKSVTINRPADELYRWWRDFTNLPRSLGYLDSVRVLDDTRSHWVARAPGNTQVEWDAEIINDIPNELIAWRSTSTPDIPNAGSVHFEPAPNGRGTIVKVELEYEPPAGRVGAAVAKLFGKEPAQTVYNALVRFKQLMETGEIATVQGQPVGSRNPLSKFQERKS